MKAFKPIAILGAAVLVSACAPSRVDNAAGQPSVYQDVGSAGRVQGVGIESQDVARLKRLKGIGERTARKIIASLRGKMDPFVRGDAAQDAGRRPPELVDAVLEVLVEQLGYHRGEARRIIDEALERNPAISAPEALLDEIFRAG